jgi:hypothetical protein
MIYNTAALRRLGVLVAAIGLLAGSAAAAPAGLGIAVGQSAAGLPETLWSQNLGYLGATACNTNLAAETGCHAGQDVLVFQPVMPGRAGRVFVTVAAGRVTAIVSDLHTVAQLDG